MSSSSKPKTRTDIGRKKVKIEKMQNESNLRVTFTKCRSGVIKKASELVTLCGAEVAIIVKCPRGKKFYSFGHPTIKQVCDKYVFGISPAAPTAGTVDQIIYARRSSKIQELNLQITQVQAILAQETKRAKELASIKIQGQIEKWHPPSLEDFNLEELQSYKERIENFEQHFNEKIKAPLSLGADQSSLPANAPSKQYDENIHGAAACSFFSFDPRSNPLPFEFDFDDFSAGFAHPGRHKTINNSNNDANLEHISDLFGQSYVANTYGAMNPSSQERSSTMFSFADSSYCSWCFQSPLPPTDSMTHWNSGLDLYTGFKSDMASGSDPYTGFEYGTGGSAPYIGFNGIVSGSDPHTRLDNGLTGSLSPHCGFNYGTRSGPSRGFNDGPGGPSY